MTSMCSEKFRKQGLLCLRTFCTGCIVYSYAPGAHAHFLTQHRYTQLKPVANEQNTPFSTTNKRYITATSRRGSGLGAPLSSWAPGPGPGRPVHYSIPASCRPQHTGSASRFKYNNNVLITFLYQW